MPILRKSKDGVHLKMKYNEGNESHIDGNNVLLVYDDNGSDKKSTCYWYWRTE